MAFSKEDFTSPIIPKAINLLLSLALEPAEVEKEVLANEQVQKYLDGKPPKKVIVVKGRIINLVV